jgi:putative ABC transport system permease protein
MRLAWRDAVRSRSKFLLIILAVSIAVAVVTVVLDLNETVQRELILGARQWLAADIQLRTNRAPAEARIRALRDLGWTTTVVTETVGQISTLAGAHVQVASVKAVDPGEYPFYGDLRLNSRRPLRELLSEDSAIVSPEVLEKLHTSIGGMILVSGAEFRITATIDNEPDRFAIMPLALLRVIVTREGFERTGMIEKGSSAVHRLLIRLPPEANLDDADRALKEIFPLEESIDYKKNAAGVAGIEEQAATYFSFLAFMVLVVAALGGGLLMSSHIQQRMDTIAIWKLLGGTTSQIVQVFLAQILAVSALGALLGVIAELGIQRVFARLLGPYLPFPPRLLPSWSAAMEGVAAGVLIPLLIVGAPILSVRLVRPYLLIRRHVEPVRAFGLESVAILALVVALCAAAAAHTSGSKKHVAWMMMGGLFAGLVACAGLALALRKAIRLAVSSFSKRIAPAIRYGALNLARRGSTMVPVVVALSLGVSFVYLAFLLEGSLLGQVMQYSPFSQAQVYVLNVGVSQKDEVLDFLSKERGVERAELDPFVTLRLIAINGRSDVMELRRTWFAAVANQKPDSVQVVGGRWWNPNEASPQIALSVRAARALGVRIGDTIEFANGPEPVNVSVAAIHSGSRPEALRYHLTLNSAAVSDVRVTYNGAVWVALGREGEVESELRRRYPSTLVLNQVEIAAVMQDTAEQVASVLTFVSAISLSGGAIVLAASLCAMRFERQQEVSILKTLGATRAKVAWSLAAEFTLLGIFASAVGIAMASMLAMLLGKYAFDPPLPAFSSWPAVGLAVVLTVAATNVAGWLAGAPLLWQRPIEILRTAD